MRKSSKEKMLFKGNTYLCKKNKDFETIEGDFVIMKGNKFFIDKRKLNNSDEVRLPIKTLKQIIKDAKNGII